MSRNVGDVILDASTIVCFTDEDGDDFFALFPERFDFDRDFQEAVDVFSAENDKPKQLLEDCIINELDSRDEIDWDDTPYVYIGSEYNILNTGKLDFTEFCLQLNKDFHNIPDFDGDTSVKRFLSENKIFVAATYCENSVENAVCLYGISSQRLNTKGQRSLIEYYCNAKGIDYENLRVTLEQPTNIKLSELKKYLDYTVPAVYYNHTTGKAVANKSDKSWSDFIKEIITQQY